MPLHLPGGEWKGQERLASVRLFQGNPIKKARQKQFISAPGTQAALRGQGPCRDRDLLSEGTPGIRLRHFEFLQAQRPESTAQHLSFVRAAC